MTVFTSIMERQVDPPTQEYDFLSSEQRKLTYQDQVCQVLSSILKYSQVMILGAGKLKDLYTQMRRVIKAKYDDDKKKKKKKRNIIVNSSSSGWMLWTSE